MICSKCNIDYPHPIKVFPVDYGSIVAGRVVEISSPPMCGICALDFINKIHGHNRQTFTGDQAEHQRQLALHYRETLKEKHD